MKMKFIFLLLTAISIACGAYAQRIVDLAPEADKLYRREYRDTLDSIVSYAISSRCFPGCQVYASIHGKVIINKAYGHFTYPDTDTAWMARRTADSLSLYHAAPVSVSVSANGNQYDGPCPPMPKSIMEMEAEMENGKLTAPHKVLCSDIYDIASLSKVSATTIMIMHLIDEHKMSTARPLGDYLKNPYGKSAPVLNVSIRSLLEHRSGIRSYVPITRFNNQLWGLKINCRTLNIEFDSSRIDEISKAAFQEIFSTEYMSGEADRRVAEGVWMRNNYQDSLRRFFFEQQMNRRKRYKYSDINMIYLQWAAENVLNTRANVFLEDKFYKPLGMETTGYLPLERFSRDRIAPTEPHQWTHRLLQGDVHDPSAAFLGGVAGNAGLFSSAQDLGILFQMLLNRGEYNGRRYLKSATVDRFTAKQPNTSRGLGFDLAPSSFASRKASRRTFGHTGFTGTCAWADPENDIVIVFLSNRVYPSQSNNNLNTLKIRQKICDAIYDGCGIGE